MNRQDVLLHLRQVIRPSAKLLADTRHMNAGDVFMAYAVGHGNALRDGRLHIAKALQLGAACVLYQPNHDQAQNPSWELDIDDERCIAVENLSKEAGWAIQPASFERFSTAIQRSSSISSSQDGFCA